eukprot:scpid76241/ scgid4008/ 
MASEAKPVCLVLSSDKSLLDELQTSKLCTTTVETEGILSMMSLAENTEMAVIDGSGRDVANVTDLVQNLHKANKKMFICVYGDKIGRNAAARIAVADSGGAMTSWSSSAVRKAADIIHGTLQPSKRAQVYKCPYCQKGGLDEDGLWTHCPMYHINEPNQTTLCPICRMQPSQNIQVHIRNFHGPVARGELDNEFHSDISLYSFGLVVCQRDDGKFLLVQEFTSCGFWVPGGRLNPGEGLISGAKRETLEEGGVEIEITGLLKMEFLPHRSDKNPFVRLRAVFLAKPAHANVEEKTVPDFESAVRDHLPCFLHVLSPAFPANLSTILGSRHWPTR